MSLIIIHSKRVININRDFKIYSLMIFVHSDYECDAVSYLTHKGYAVLNIWRSSSCWKETEQRKKA